MVPHGRIVVIIGGASGIDIIALVGCLPLAMGP